jgi:hypothetical protein
MGMLSTVPYCPPRTPPKIRRTDVAWVSTLLCLAVAAVHVLRLVAAPTDVGEAAHALMGLGMAAMLSPVGDPVPTPVWVGAFACATLWFTASALREGTWVSPSVHHVVGGVATLVMLAPSSGPPASGGAESGGHAHAAGEGVGMGLSSLASVLLAGYFVWRAVEVLLRWPGSREALPGPAPDTRSGGPPVGVQAASTVSRLRVEPIAQSAVVSAAAALVMSAVMALMLLGVV